MSRLKAALRRWLVTLDEAQARRLAYAVVAAAVPIIGLVWSQEQAASTASVIVAILLIIRAILRAQSLTAQLVYAVLAAIGTAAVAFQVLDPSLVSSVLGIVATMLGTQIAALRTDPTTPTGEPALEYAARHVSADRLP